MMLIGYWIKSSLLQFLIDQVITHVEAYEQIWLLIELLEHADLVHWGSLDDPSVGFAVRHEESLSQELHDHVLRYRLSELDDLAEFLGLVALTTYVVLQHMVHIDLYQLVLLADLVCVLSQLNSRWTHQDDLWGLPWGLRVLQRKHAGHLLHYLSLRLVAVDLDNVANELLLDALDVDAVLSDSVPGDRVKLKLIVVLGSCTALN